MSGHNKWSKIKHKKAATDAQKSKMFSKVVKLIQVEAKLAHGNVDSPGLKAAIEKAKKVNMPSDNIDRAIKKASESSANMENMMYEGYGPGGVGVIITALTDNRNRAAGEIKHALSKNGALLGAPNSVSWNFTKTDGEWIPNTTMDLEDDDLEKLGALVEALEELDDVQDVYTNAS